MSNKGGKTTSRNTNRNDGRAKPMIAPSGLGRSTRTYPSGGYARPKSK